MGRTVEGVSSWVRENRFKYKLVIVVPCQLFLHKGWWGWNRVTD